MLSNIKSSRLAIMILYRNQRRIQVKLKKKVIKVLLLSKLGNIKKEKLKIKKLAKGNY